MTRRTLRTAAASAACALAASATAGAAITDHPLPRSSPGVSTYYWEHPIATWNGAVWVAQGNGGALARFAPNGAVSEVPIPDTDGDGEGPTALSVGPEGLWMLANHGRRAILHTADGGLSAADLGGFVGASTFTAAPDGGIWHTDHLGDDSVTRLTRQGATRFDADLSGHSVITAVADGRAWFAQNDFALVQIDRDGTQTRHPLPGPCTPSVGCALPAVTGLTSAADGTLWYTRSGQRTITTGRYTGFNTQVALVGRMAPSGRATEWELPHPKLAPHSITMGPDGHLWFATSDGLGRVSRTGQVRVFDLPGNRRADGLTVGPDRALWFVDSRLNRVTRLTTTDARALGGPEIRSTALRQVNGRIPLRLACPAAGSPCVGTVRITSPRALVAQASFRIGSGRTATVRAPIRAAAERLVRSARTPVTVTVRPRSGAVGDQRELALRR